MTLSMASFYLGAVTGILYFIGAAVVIWIIYKLQTETLGKSERVKNFNIRNKNFIHGVWALTIAGYNIYFLDIGMGILLTALFYLIVLLVLIYKDESEEKEREENSEKIRNIKIDMLLAKEGIEEPNL